MKHSRAIAALFTVAALYDGALGALFLVAPGAAFSWYDVPPPGHLGYVRFPAALLITFGLMFAAIAADPCRNRNLIVYGMLLKVSYCGVVFSYWLSTGIPNMWKPFAVADIVFLALFAWARLALARSVGRRNAG